MTARSEDDSPISADPEVRARGLAGDEGRASTHAPPSVPPRSAGRSSAPLGVFTGAGPTGGGAQAIGREPARRRAEHAATRDVTIVVEYLNRFEMYLTTAPPTRPRSSARSTIRTAA